MHNPAAASPAPKGPKTTLPKDLKVWRNIAPTAKVGRDPTYKHALTSEINEEHVPHIAPGGQSTFIGPGDEIYDDKGRCRNMLDNSYSYFVECHDEDELKVLGVSEADAVWSGFKNGGNRALLSISQQRELAGPDATDDQVFARGGDPRMGKLLGFRGVHYVLKDVSEEFGAAMSVVGSRTGSAKRLGEMELRTKAAEAALSEKDVELATERMEKDALKSEIEELKKKLSADAEATKNAGAASLSQALSSPSGNPVPIPSHQGGNKNQQKGSGK